MSNLARMTLGSLLLCSMSGAAYAQQAAPAEPVPTQDMTTADAPDESGADVIVTATRTAKAVDRIPGAITIISPAEVQRTLALTEDATAVLARIVPGYSESNQSLNTLGETMRGRTALYLFDGIPQSTPLRDGSRNATFTDMSTVQRIEVIGGASAAEGIGAAGGIINYISKRATETGLHFGATGRIGSQFRDDSEVWKIGGTVAYKQGGFDAFLAAAYVDRGITYDARGRRIGLSISSSLADSTQRNVFAKIGTNFGEGDTQRLELVGSYFRLASKGNYHYVAGSRALGIPDTAEAGPPLGTGGVSLAGTEFNDFKQVALNYSNTELLGGSLVATAYWARQAMRFPGDNSADRQDPAIAPIGQLVDQSEILSKKYGLRTSWSRPDFLLKGLELRIGIDAVHDNTQQRLALTNRIWVPPLDYTSFGPYAQLSYDIGPVTLTGGLRHEDGRVKVDDYTTTYFRNGVAVKGGTLKYKNDLLNAGAIWRIGGGFSVFGSYNEGFTLPNVGIPLRNVNVAGKTVEGLLDLKAVIFESREAGFNWRGKWGSVGASYYVSKSQLGSTLAIDPVTRDYILNRRPIRIEGIDFTAEFRPTSTVKLTALYSHVKGTTTAANNVTSPLDVTLGTVNISPDKINGAVEWRFVPNGSVTLGASSILSRHINEGKGALEERTRGYTLFDLTVNYKLENIGRFALGVENLTNRFYFLSSSQVDIFQNYFAGRGRTVSLTLHRDF
ncbi:TonB-dependent receptor [Sphingomonas sp. ERG5]|uniref:TonB-dependent receptor n=1 Tax=Sphingomonas sp. ERG5 TaxID=1381597 RepID=UPI00054C4D2E|nr:TonB-dependent receptor [Sphingomonas sp. ERG5]